MKKLMRATEDAHRVLAKKKQRKKSAKEKKKQRKRSAKEKKKQRKRSGKEKDQQEKLFVQKYVFFYSS